MTRQQVRPSTLAMGRLTAELKGGGIALTSPGIASFDAVRVTGPTGELFVAARNTEDGIDFLAPPDPDDTEGPYVQLGTEAQVTQVAGIIRRRVGAA